MKNLLLLLLLFSITFVRSQSDTEIFLFDIDATQDKPVLNNKKNISQNKGYDSQPQFLADNVIIYAGTREGQTEIIQYMRGTSKQFNTSTQGGEYSPQFMMGKRGISAVRLDPDGLQRLYHYLPRKTETPTLVKDAVVAYYTWFDKNTIVGADIVGDNLHLVIHHLDSKKTEDLKIAVSRSFHKIPETPLVSFIDKTSQPWMVKSFDPATKKITNIIPLDEGVEDINWLPDGRLLAAKGNTIFVKDKNAWKVFHSFKDTTLQDITRFAIAPSGNQIAIVSTISQPKSE